MATQAYYDWIAAGKPWRKAIPVAEYQAAFVKAGWPVTSLGTIGDSAHLTADRPQDHTPFSVTGWPGGNPYPFVLALDASHGGVRESALDSIVAYWVTQARAGKTPWVKYIVYKGQRWDVRNDWAPVAASGHHDHVHKSFRTDWHDKTIGGYPVVGGGNPVGTTQTGRDVWAEPIASPSLNYTQPAGEWLKWVLSGARGVERLEASVVGLHSAVQTLLDRPGGVVDPVALGQTLAASGPFVDAIATAVAAKLGMIPTAGEIARQIGELDWHGSVK